MDVTAEACWEEGARLHPELRRSGGQPALGAVPGPLWGRLLGGLWDELGCPA